jgi:ATP-dependent RNA helicase RhlE
MSFDSLGLSAELLRAVAEEGYDTPTPIQSQAIPVILQGRDVLAGAQTGTGKTAGFTLPMLQLLASKPVEGRRRIRTLVMVPTRELAAQVAASIETYGRHLPKMTCAVVFGGVSINPQIATLRRGVDILVATPGRLLDHAQQRTVDLSAVEILVLDEADRMLDMGFIRDIRKVIAMLPRQRQNLLFSATFSDDIRTLANTLLTEPVQIEVARRNTPTELVTQVVHPVDRGRKRELLSHLMHAGDWRQVLIFTRTKALADFKAGSVRALVATEVAARGLDIDQLPHVVNFELPHVAEDYVHRIGRTGRAGSEGEAVSLVCVDERRLLSDIERVLNREIPRRMIAGFEPDPSIRAEPIETGRRSAPPQKARGRNGPERHGRRSRGPRPENRRICP